MSPRCAVSMTSQMPSASKARSKVRDSPTPKGSLSKVEPMPPNSKTGSSSGA